LCGFAQPHFAAAGLCFAKPLFAAAKRQLPVTLYEMPPKFMQNINNKNEVLTKKGK